MLTALLTVARTRQTCQISEGVLALLNQNGFIMVVVGEGDTFETQRKRSLLPPMPKFKQEIDVVKRAYRAVEKMAANQSLFNCWQIGTIGHTVRLLL